MAANIPAPLRSADIARFVQRAGQVEKAKPVVAYWCNYWIVNQILSKGLHNTDDECMTFTMNLMDKLEQTKSEYVQDDAIMDDAAGQAYIENFGEETLQRAENAMRANKASRQTADTLQAAATFLDLCQIWAPPEPELASKVKFAKYHALRIAKAIKAGEDPNLSNPAPEPVPTNETMGLDPSDPDVQMLSGPPANLHDQIQTYQPSVEEVSDDRLERHLAQRSTMNESIHPSRAPSNQRQPDQNWDHPSEPSPQEIGENYYHAAACDEVSPLVSPKADRNSSDGGGYFPRVSNPDDSIHSALSDAPPRDPGSPRVPDLPDASALPPAPFQRPDERPLYLPHGDSLESFPPPHMNQPTAPIAPRAQLPQHSHAQPAPRQTPAHLPGSFNHPSPTTQYPSHVMKANPSRSVVSPAATSKLNYVADEEAVLKAQKHARWAISALNFEDVNTAVKELRGALEALGVT